LLGCADAATLVDVVTSPHFSVDVEITNRCNAHCDFCPRDRTPHQGTMGPDVFSHALGRIIEFREYTRAALDAEVTLSFCGLGETMLNRHLVEYVRRAADAGFEPSMCSNASRLDEENTRRLVDAGLRRIYINSGEIGPDYDRVYELSFDRMRDNIARFLELARDRCELHIVLVDHHQNRQYVRRLKRFWTDLGVTHFFPSPMLNRSGTLDVENMAFELYPEHAVAQAMFDTTAVRPVCPAPFAFPFIGYDGNYYLCSSDWEKRSALGNVVDHSFLSTIRSRWTFVESRQPVCHACNHDPVNRLTTELRLLAQGESTDEAVRDLIAMLTARTTMIRALVETLAPPSEHARIPVRVI
jgi:MoaA/NifB/PqqE/SkfB family radical SAM enzyme